MFLLPEKVLNPTITSWCPSWREYHLWSRQEEVTVLSLVLQFVAADNICLDRLLAPELLDTSDNSQPFLERTCVHPVSESWPVCQCTQVPEVLTVSSYLNLCFQAPEKCIPGFLAQTCLIWCCIEKLLSYYNSLLLISSTPGKMFGDGHYFSNRSLGFF